MVSGIGEKKPRRGGAMAIVIPVIVLAVLAAGAAGILYVQHQGKIAEAKSWLPAGAPCEAVTQAVFGPMAMSEPRAVTIDGVQMARGSGQVTCGEAPNLAGSGVIPVCQFTDPTTLDVTVGGQHFYYLPRSSPATVSIVDGKPSCVLAAGRPAD